jgi:peptide/nickel transport system ATP-binding protein
MSDDPILSVRDLTKHYPIIEGLLRRETGRVRAVDGISFDVHRGETLGLVGESGCGKSTTARTLLQIEEPTEGTVVFDDDDLGEYTSSDLKHFRRQTSMIFQDPTSCFDPRMTVGESVAEPLVIHGLRDRDRQREIAETLLCQVGLSSEDYDRYPHEFSGGQKQRVALARALVLNPELLIADEPVSALDVSVQAEILSLMSDLQTAFDLSILLITHDMNVVRDVCDRVAVMYLGEIVEIGQTEEVFVAPQHPYTRALLASVPTLDPDQRGQRAELSGDVPDPSNPPAGCRFHTRCPAVIQPEEYAFDQEVWRRVMDLRIALRERTLDIVGLRERLVAETAKERTDHVSDAQLQTAIRTEYDIPTELSDATAEHVLSTALSDVVAGNTGAADERLGEAFSTVCERQNPSLRETATDHPAACLLHTETDETTELESIPSTSRED